MGYKVEADAPPQIEQAIRRVAPSAAELVNIAIRRAFVRLRKTLSLHQELAHKLAELERKIEKHDENIRTLFEAICQLMTPPPEKPRRETGFVSRKPAWPIA
jgi:hypothetical protein